MSLLEQYISARLRHPDKIVLFRDGVAYWCYGTDAVLVKLAGGDCAGFAPEGPGAEANANFHRNHLDMVLRALLRAGHRVAVC
jgi:DNA mismatch repair ATPase MutS